MHQLREAVIDEMKYIFFFLGSILFSLFFGEAKQGIIELVWVIVTLMFFLFHSITAFRKKQPLRIPNTWSFLFLAALISLLISTIYSASIAYSLSFILRTITAWCLFVLVYAVSKKPTSVSTYARGLFWLGTGIALGSILFRFLPTLAHAFPAMNLIFSHTGHNQGVYLLVTLFPIALHYAEHRNIGIIRAIAYILFPLAIMLCFSRGALLITGIYLLLVGPKKHPAIRMIIGMCVGAVFLLFCTSFLPQTTQELIKKLPVEQMQFLKSKPTGEARFSNWKQAIIGFAAHPLIGTGPNTYILTSMQYHQTPIDGASLAHNWYLQTLSEVGIIGSIPIAFILFFVIRTLWHKRKEQKHDNKASWMTVGLIDSVFVALVYSCIEYNLDYFTLWILLWSTIGLLLQQNKETKHTGIAGGITLICICVLSIYAGTNWYANTRLATIETATQRFFFQAYNLNQAERYIEYKNSINQPLTQLEKTIILTLYRKQPDVLITLANAAHIIAPEERKQWYETAISFNPLNAYYYQTYVTFLYEQKNPTEMQAVFTLFINNAYHMTNPAPSSPIVFDPTIILYLTPDLFSQFSGTASFSEVASKTLYAIGLASLSTAPTMTENLWTLAKDISPGWGLFHLELSSYYLYIGHDKLHAQQLLFACLHIESPAKACQEALTVFPNLEQPGYFQEHINAIPK